MREIKFRAWDKEDKKMFNIARFDFADNTVYSHLFACDGYLGESLEILQYTGLKDKDGLEIYEGDILYDEHYDVYGVVTFEEGKFSCESATFSDDLWEVCDDMVVINNIYETPELAEEVTG